MNPTVEKWFKGKRDYAEGCQLYLKHGDDEFLKKLFQKSITVFNRKKLEQELRNISDATPDIPIKKRFEVATKKEYAGLPAEVKKLKEVKDILFKEMRHLHSQLVHYKTDKEREAPAFRILVIVDQLMTYWKKLDYYAEHKKLPQEELKVEKAVTPAVAVRRIHTLRTYISRAPQSAKLQDWKDDITRLNKIAGA